MGFTVSVQGAQKLELEANPLWPECNVSVDAAYLRRYQIEMALIQIHLQHPNPCSAFKVNCVYSQV